MRESKTRLYHLSRFMRAHVKIIPPSVAQNSKHYYLFICFFYLVCNFLFSVLIGTPGNIWWYNFYISMQSDISTKMIKPNFWCTPLNSRYAPCNVCIGKPYVCNVLCTCAYALHKKWGIPVTHYFDDLYPICSEQHCSKCACIVWHCHACNYTVGPKKAITQCVACYTLSRKKAN